MTEKLWGTGVNKSASFVAMALTVVTAFAGCGSGDSLPRAGVAGSVTLDGVALPMGSIRFVPVEDTPGQITSVQISDGRFEAQAAHGPTVGKHRIEIESTDMGGLEMDDEDAIDRMKSEGTRRIKTIKVPPWYNRSSVLSETIVAEGPNELTFELSSKKKRR